MHYRYEDAVLNGTALVLLELPPFLRKDTHALRKHLDRVYPHNGATHMCLNDPPVRSTSGEGVMELGALFFSSAKAAWAILDQVDVVLRTEDGPLELRRGYLKLGRFSVLLEGVVTWGGEGRERPREQPAAASAPSQDTKPPSPSMSQRDPRGSPRPDAQLSGPLSSSGPRESSAGIPAAHHAPPPGTLQTVVVSMHFKEVYNRHRNDRDGRHRQVHRDGPTMFPLSPFMVYQLLLGECQPRKVVFIDSRRLSDQRVVRVLVEVDNVEVASHIIKVFTHRAVEFVSESDGYHNPDRIKRLKEKSAAPHVCAEVRYYVNSFFSVPNGQSRYLPNGERNLHRTIVVRTQQREALSVTLPQDVQRMTAKAPREWQPDPHAHRPASVRERDSPGRDEVYSPEPRTGAKRFLEPPQQQQQQQHEAGANSNSNKRHRSRTPPRSRHSTRSRSPSQSRSASSRRSSASTSSSRSSSSASSSSSRYQHYRRREKHEDSRRSTSAHRGSRDGREEEKSKQPEAQVAKESVVVVAAAPVQQEPPAQQQAVSPSPAAVQQTTAVAPPSPPVQTNALPPGWRPIFSEEYQQTYYAFRDPATGTETTTWERPTA